MCIRDSFEKQYILTQTVEVEVRYRTETRTDSEGNDYDVEVPYNYYICKVKLENFDLSHVPVYICLLYTSVCASWTTTPGRSVSSSRM